MVGVVAFLVPGPGLFFGHGPLPKFIENICVGNDRGTMVGTMVWLPFLGVWWHISRKGRPWLRFVVVPIQGAVVAFRLKRQWWLLDTPVTQSGASTNARPPYYN